MLNFNIAKFQIVEYFRAFLTGRTSLSKLDAILIISGAFGAFNKKAVIECGGYKVGVIGEDMDIVVRLHKMMIDQKRKYNIQFLAEPICWTQSPEALKDLRTQRRRWQIGLFDTLLNYKSMLFNPKYGTIGLISLPYYWLYELVGTKLPLVRRTMLRSSWTVNEFKSRPLSLIDNGLDLNSLDVLG